MKSHPKQVPVLLFLAIPSLIAPVMALPAAEFYVSPQGSDRNPGSAARPFDTLQRAQEAVRAFKDALPPGGVRVILRSGEYFLPRTLTLGPEDSGTPESPILWTAAPNEKVLVSGGRLIQGWQNGKANLWTVKLPRVAAGTWYFRQLFAGKERLTRARLPKTGYLLPAGPLTKYAGVIKHGHLGDAAALRRTHPEAFCGFQFEPGDIQPWPDIDNAEIITLHSWEASWQTIRQIDQQTHDVYFNSPCRYPVGTFSPHCRYRVENIREALTEPGEWQLDRKTGLLSYLARPGEDPNRMGILAPTMEKLLVFRGDYKNRKYVQNITFHGITFCDASYPMGIYDVVPDWPASALKVDPAWPKDFPPGYTDAQASPLCGQAIEMDSARSCALDRCEITRVGAYGVGIFTGSSGDRVVGCLIDDVGGGGILVRHPGSVAGLDKNDAPHDNIVENNTIRHVSLVHPSAVGIMVAQAHHNRIAHNEISEVGYAGIHLGWTWGRAPNDTTDNLIEANHVHNVMRDLADAAGIYSLGIQTGTIYRDNYVHNIHRAGDVMGGPVAGLYFDEGSRDILVEQNVVRDVSRLLNFNRCKPEEQTWKDNDFEGGPGTVSGLPPGSTLLQVEAPDADHTNNKAETIMRSAGPEPAFRWK